MAEVNFYKLLKEFKIRRVIFGMDMILAILFSTVIYLCWYELDFFQLHDKNLFYLLMQVSGTLFGLLFASFAILLSLSTDRFVKVLNQNGLFNKLVFPFWWVSLVFILSIILDFIVVISFGREIVYLD